MVEEIRNLTSLLIQRNMKMLIRNNLILST